MLAVRFFGWLVLADLMLTLAIVGVVGVLLALSRYPYVIPLWLAWIFVTGRIASICIERALDVYLPTGIYTRPPLDQPIVLTHR